MSEEAVVKQLLRDWCEATNQPGEAGADGYVAFVSDDCTVLPPNAELAEGRDGVREFVLEFTQAEGWSVRWEPTRVEVSPAGNLAYAIGRYQFSLTDPDGNAVEDRGKFLDTLRKAADGSWKVTAISFNSDLPAPG